MMVALRLALVADFTQDKFSKETNLVQTIPDGVRSAFLNAPLGFE